MAKEKKVRPDSASVGISPVVLPQPILNNVRKNRKEAGLTKVALARLCGLSEKTIARIEREQEAFASTTYYKIRNGLNKALRKEGKAELGIKDLFPTLDENE